jgi:hypothetical protein
VSGRPEGLHYIGVENAIVGVLQVRVAQAICAPIVST